MVPFGILHSVRSSHIKQKSRTLFLLSFRSVSPLSETLLAVSALGSVVVADSAIKNLCGGLASVCFCATPLPPDFRFRLFFRDAMPDNFVSSILRGPRVTPAWLRRLDCLYSFIRIGRGLSFYAVQPRTGLHL